MNISVRCKNCKKKKKNWGVALEQLHGSFSYIAAHQDLQNPNLVIPALLIKKTMIWPGYSYLFNLGLHEQRNFIEMTEAGY